MLKSHGHRVIRYTVHNDSVEGKGRAGLAASTVWNRESYRTVRDIVRAEKPDVAHFHNTFPLISPSAYYAARSEGAAVVQTLHNYRLLCLNAMFYRDGHLCEDCLGKPAPWPGVAHSCYRNSRTASAAVATMLSVHRGMKTWTDKVDAYITLTEFARNKLVGSGMPAGKVLIKPNFVVDDPGPGDGKGGYFFFVGRLSPEKGIETMISAWKRLGVSAPGLKIAGDGPLAEEVRMAASRVPQIEYVGVQSKAAVLELMKSAKALIVPSKWYEGFPMVIAEAYSAGLPVIASNLGGMSSIVLNGKTGLHFEPGDADDLTECLLRASKEPELLDAMRPAVRQEFLDRYSAEKSYARLEEIYASAIKARKGCAV